MLRYSTYQSIYNKPSMAKTNVTGFQGIRLRKGLTRIMMVIILLTITCTGMVSAFADSETNHVVDIGTVIVKSGDTLWEIAAASKPRGKDTRDYIEHIKMYNGLTTSAIQAGDVLMLPAK